MNLKKIALAAAIACVSYTGNAMAQEGPIQLVSGCADTSCAAAPCGCGQPACGCESVGGLAGLGCLGGDSCDGGCDSGCDSACGSCLGDCDLGDPWTLFGEHCGWTAGGWLSMGYHDKGNGLFNSRPDEFQVHQAWMYIEKEADGSDGLGFGGRFDAMYGTDSQDTQSFGADRGWDNGFDNGPDYGFALPQAYIEAAYGDTSVKIGQFYTIIGWEVVTAPDNFFYSHAYTMYNSEPFTHTGVLATHNASDDLTVWGGYTFGWDSGFNDNGDCFLGGFSATLTDKLALTYATTIGRFGEARFNGVEKGYMHSIVTDYAVTDSLQWIGQSDYLSSEDGDGVAVRDTFGINNYLIKSINDCTSVGARFEWWNAEFGGTGDSDVYALTLGVNHRPHANVIVRPEVRWDWDDDQITGLEDGDDQTTFGIDTIFTF
ncbi:porin [Planctomycetes bacterium K23_9]|uniref:Porin n=1 Tax=Stieleria marina TaxID=1930275 RepID=A0A517NPP2_9BACT|nr:hypothetical protein K239x_10370 [Planctomycetes bacterium K23_9]